jgi:hypothetical protein
MKSIKGKIIFVALAILFVLFSLNFLNKDRKIKVTEKELNSSLISDLSNFAFNTQAKLDKLENSVIDYKERAVYKKDFFDSIERLNNRLEFYLSFNSDFDGSLSNRFEQNIGYATSFLPSIVPGVLINNINYRLDLLTKLKDFKKSYLRLFFKETGDVDINLTLNLETKYFDFRLIHNKDKKISLVNDYFGVLKDSLLDSSILISSKRFNLYLDNRVSYLLGKKDNVITNYFNINNRAQIDNTIDLIINTNYIFSSESMNNRDLFLTDLRISGNILNLFLEYGVYGSDKLQNIRNNNMKSVEYFKADTNSMFCLNLSLASEFVELSLDFQEFGKDFKNDLSTSTIYNKDSFLNYYINNLEDAGFISISLSDKRAKQSTKRFFFTKFTDTDASKIFLSFDLEINNSIVNLYSLINVDFINYDTLFIAKLESSNLIFNFGFDIKSNNKNNIYSSELAIFTNGSNIHDIYFIGINHFENNLETLLSLSYSLSDLGFFTNAIINFNVDIKATNIYEDLDTKIGVKLASYNFIDNFNFIVYPSAILKKGAIILIGDIYLEYSIKDSFIFAAGFTNKKSQHKPKNNLIDINKSKLDIFNVKDNTKLKLSCSFNI